jgi:hypothetical protein
VRAKTNNSINRLLAQLAIQPVLLDIGASGATPEIWEPIASRSLYIGFDPDLREMRETTNGQFQKAIVVNEAVVAAAADEVTFFLTRSPFCSSTLPPDAASLSNYLFADLFAVERQAKVRATTFDSLFARLGLSAVDWFKTDTQGTDLQLFNSLKAGLRDRVLAVDIEPGLIDAYIGEDLFIEVHKSLTDNGFWLSDLRVMGAVRMRPATLAKLKVTHPDLDQDRIQSAVRPSPGWCEARYLRTADWLAQKRLGQREYVLLWAFALLDGQFGFALDLAAEFERSFGPSETSATLAREPIQRLRQSGGRLRRSVEKLLPRPLRRPFRRLFRG